MTTAPYEPVQVSVIAPIGKTGPVGPRGPAGPMAPPAAVRPHDVGVIAWTANPQRFTTYPNYGSGAYLGRVLCFSFMSDLGGSVSKITYGVNAAGAGLANCFIGIYDTPGNLLCTSADQSANMMTANSAPVINLTTPIVLAPGTWYQIAMLIGAATTGCTFAGFGMNSAAFTNLGLPSGKYLCSYSSSVTGLTALPATRPAAMTSIAGGIIAVMS